MKRLIHFLLLLAVLISSFPLSQMDALAAPAGEEAAVGEHSLVLSGLRPPPGDGLDFSGYVEVPYSATLNSMTKLTIEAWVKRSGVNRNETIVGNGWQGSYWLGFNNTGRIRFITHGSDQVDSNSTVPAGVWTHVAVTYDGLTRNFYINGVLDRSTTTGSGAITYAPGGQSLGIGFDVNDNFTPNYFGGNIDELRIWNTVRPPTKIRETMFTSFTGPQPVSNLLASWTFEGNANDGIGGHNGTLRGAADFNNDGALPRDIRITQVNVTPTLDGDCNTTSEYGNSMWVTVGGADAYLLHTATDLWICFNNLANPVVNATQNGVSVYLDSDLSRIDPAQPDDLMLSIGNTNTLSAQEGDGNGGYVVTTAADGKWDGKYRNCCGEFPTRSAEFRIAGDLVGGWGHVIGLALAQHEVVSIGGALLWPALAVDTLPSTWSRATLSAVGSPRTFTGQVVYQPKGNTTPVIIEPVQPAPVAVPNVGVRLVGFDNNGAQAVVDFSKSGVDGSFTLIGTDDYPYHRLEMDTATLPKGYLPKKAAAPAPAQAVDARVLNYSNAAPGAYANNVFTLGDATPFVLDSQHGPYLLIVAPQSVIDAGALANFTDYKFRQGFTVEVISIEAVDTSFAGKMRADKIRALEMARYDTLGTRFGYVMLIGTPDVIPYPIITVNTTGKDGNVCTDLESGGANWKYSDWYYVDLTSNFDSNNNGCLADGAWTKASDLAQGYTPDSGIAFVPTVALGRIPFTNPLLVAQVLKNSMGYEQQANPFKRETALAMSMVAVSGYMYEDGETKPCSGKWGQRCVAPDPNASFDLASLGNALKADFLDARNYSSETFYEQEAAVAGGAPWIPDQLLTEANLVNALKMQTRGFVNLGGHGNSSGVYRTFWGDDANNNGRADLSTKTSDVSEMDGGNLLTNGALSGSHISGGVYVMAACSTASPGNTGNFAATILSQGYGVASIGALNIVTVGSWKAKDDGVIQSTDYYISNYLLDRNLRAGDAFWHALADRIQKPRRGSGELAMDYFGDPTLSYWGNPGGQTTLAAWPMLRFDARGQSFTALNGPGVVKKLWEYTASPVNVNTLSPSPVVSNNGEVIVAHGSFVDVLRNGVLFQRLTLDAAAYGTPAIAADGTVYALDANGKLYGFMYQKSDIDGYLFNSVNRYRRWATNLGAAPSTSPVIGPNGMIAVGAGGLRLVRADGFLFKSYAVSGEIVGAVSWDGDQGAYVTTTTGYFGRIDFFCATNSMCELGSSAAGTAYSTPALVAYGSAFAGRADGKIVRFLTNSSFQADSAITAGPVSGPGGQILIGTQNGTLYSLNQDLTLRWQRSIGEAVRSIPAFSLDALYLVSGNRLRAFDPFSGTPLWTRVVTNAGYGSAAVGYGRELYIQTSSGKIYGFGEGWQPPVLQVSASPLPLTAGRHMIRVEFSLPISLTVNPVNAVAVDTVQGLLLQRSADGNAWEDLAVLPPGTDVFSDSNVLDNTSYAYRVQVLDSQGNDSEFTETQQPVQSLPAVPAAPVLAGVNVSGSDQLVLDWSPAANAVVESYRVEHSDNQAGPFAEVTSVGADVTSFVHSGLTPNSAHFYRVIAVNGNGVSPASNVLGATTRQQTLAAPQNVTAILLDGGAIEVNWNGAVEGAISVLEVSVPGLEGYQPVGGTSGNGPFVYNANEENAYDFRVKFVQGNNESPYAYTTASVVIAEAAQTLLFLPTVQR